MSTPPDYNTSVRRAALPEVLFGDDVAFALGIPVETADDLTRRGRFGPVFLVSGRPALLRDHFVEALVGFGQAPPDDREVLP